MNIVYYDIEFCELFFIVIKICISRSWLKLSTMILSFVNYFFVGPGFFMVIYIKEGLHKMGEWCQKHHAAGGKLPLAPSYHVEEVK